MSTRNALDIAVSGAHQGFQTRPAAGAGLSMSPVSRARSELIALSFKLTTDANAADRQVILEVSTGVFKVRIAASLVLQPASEEYRYIMGIGQTSSTAAVNDQVVIGFPPEILVGHTWCWNLEVLNIQATDQMGDVYIHEKYWVFEQ